MNENSQLDAEQLRKIREDILDSIDEELEMAMEDGENEHDSFASDEERKNRAVYFRELLRLQGELVKLQDWVVATKLVEQGTNLFLAAYLLALWSCGVCKTHTQRQVAD